MRLSANNLVSLSRINAVCGMSLCCFAGFQQDFCLQDSIPDHLGWAPPRGTYCLICIAKKHYGTDNWDLHILGLPYQASIPNLQHMGRRRPTALLCGSPGRTPYQPLPSMGSTFNLVAHGTYGTTSQLPAAPMTGDRQNIADLRLTFKQTARAFMLCIGEPRFYLNSQPFWQPIPNLL